MSQARVKSEIQERLRGKWEDRTCFYPQAFLRPSVRCSLFGVKHALWLSAVSPDRWIVTIGSWLAVCTAAFSGLVWILRPFDGGWLEFRRHTVYMHAPSTRFGPEALPDKLLRRRPIRNIWHRCVAKFVEKLKRSFLNLDHSPAERFSELVGFFTSSCWTTMDPPVPDADFTLELLQIKSKILFVGSKLPWGGTFCTRGVPLGACQHW